MNTFERIAKLLDENGISGAKMSRDLGFSSGLFSQWKKGTQEPSLEKAHKMAEYFGVSVDYLVGNVNEPFFHLDNEKMLQDINAYGNIEVNQTEILTGCMKIIYYRDSANINTKEDEFYKYAVDLLKVAKGLTLNQLKDVLDYMHFKQRRNGEQNDDN